MEDKFILGAIESPVDLRDYDYSMLASATDVEIPENFELDYDIPVQNQGNVGSCVAHALMEMKSYIDNDMYSIGFIYGNRNDKDFHHREQKFELRDRCQGALGNICLRGQEQGNPGAQGTAPEPHPRSRQG